MATVIRVPNLRDGYAETVRQIALEGKAVSPRGRPTLELTDAVIQVEDPTDCLPTGVGRRLNARIAAIEACQLISGCGRPDLLTTIAPNFRNYQEDDGSFHGNYGSRIGTQFAHACWKLREDPDTRQAIISLWNPALDNQPGKRDYPCTLVLQLRLRGGQLQLTTTMRSNDGYLGLAYDGFQFTQLQLTAARILGVDPGPYTHYAGSLHLYLDDVEAGRISALQPSGDPKPEGLPEGFGTGTGSPEHVMMRAFNVLHNHPVEDETSSEAWYRRQLHGDS